VNPRPQLRAEILDTIDQLERSQPEAHPSPVSSAAVAQAAPAGAASGAAANVISIPSRMRYLMAASIAIAIMSSSAAIYFAYEWRTTEHELAMVNSDNARMAQDRDAMKARLDRNSNDLAVLRQEDNRVVRMKGLAPAPNTLATVYWNPASREVHLDRGNLPTPPRGKQYQLWAISNGKPVDAGMIASNAPEELQRMKSIAQAEAFAVTLEPAGGSASPTLDAMYVMGKLGS
jgi:anti-sigma-K factor RskA